MIDLHRPPMAFAFSPRERELLVESTTLRKVDLIGMRLLCERVGHEKEWERYHRLIEELDLLRAKLGDMTEEETCRPTTTTAE